MQNVSRQSVEPHVPKDVVQNEIDETATLGALLGAIEIGLGSVLHSLKVPLAGHFLSLNQCFLLGRAVKRLGPDCGFVRRLPTNASNVTALLKSLSPAGKKLTPMLAISMQGFLFNVGVFVFGANVVGITLGTLVSALWAFVQAPLIMLLIFGEDLVRALEQVGKSLSKVVTVVPETLLLVVGIFVFAKLLLGCFVVFMVYKLPEQKFLKYTERLLSASKIKRSQFREPGEEVHGKSLAIQTKLAFRDLFNKWFVLSLCLTVGFFVFVEASVARTLWLVLRSVAVGFLIFFLIRVLPLEKVFGKINGGPFQNLARSAERAVRLLKEM